MQWFSLVEQMVRYLELPAGTDSLIMKHARSHAPELEQRGVMDGCNPHSVSASLVLHATKTLQLACTVEDVAAAAGIHPRTLKQNFNRMASVLPARASQALPTRPCASFFSEHDPNSPRAVVHATRTDNFSVKRACPSAPIQQAPSKRAKTQQPEICQDQDDSCMSYMAAIRSCQMRANVVEVLDHLPVVRKNVSFVGDFSSYVPVALATEQEIILDMDDF